MERLTAEQMLKRYHIKSIDKVETIEQCSLTAMNEFAAQEVAAEKQRWVEKIENRIKYIEVLNETFSYVASACTYELTELLEGEK